VFCRVFSMHKLLLLLLLAAAVCADGAVSYLIIINKLMHMHEIGTEPSLSPELIHSVMTQLKDWRADDSDDNFLLDADIVPTTNPASPIHAATNHVPSPAVVAFNVELATFMSAVVSRSWSVLSSDEWDFVLCSLVSWFQTLNSASLSVLRVPSVMALTAAVSRLLRCSAVCIQNVFPQQPEASPSSLVAEWKDVFSGSAFSMALLVYVSLAADAMQANQLMVRAELCWVLSRVRSLFDSVDLQASLASWKVLEVLGPDSQKILG